MINKKSQYYALEFELDSNNALIPVGFFSQYCEFDGNNELREIACVKPDIYAQIWKMQKIDYSILNSQSEFNKYVNSEAKGEIPITEELLKKNVGWLISFSFSVGDDDNWVKVSDRDKLICSYYASIQQKINAARLEERDRILANMAHSIKNLVATSVIDPLKRLESEGNADSAVIHNALKGADMIRRVINAMNLSYSGSFDDFQFDARNPSGEVVGFRKCVLESFKTAFANMFDGSNFGKFQKGYFPHGADRKEQFKLLLDAKKALDALPEYDMDALVEYAEKYFFNLSVELKNIDGFEFGDSKSSATKLMILFQEMILNAVKYASFIPRKDRFVDVSINGSQCGVDIRIDNTSSPEVKEKSTGLGNVIIANMAKLMNAEYEINKNDNRFSVAMSIPNFWNESDGASEYPLGDNVSVLFTQS